MAELIDKPAAQYTAHSLSGERKSETKHDDAEVYRAERFFGRFQRTVTLPAPVAVDKIKAAYKDGVLTIDEFPKGPLHDRFSQIDVDKDGKVTADTVTVQLTLHRGTDREQKIRRQVPIGADDTMFTIDLPEGRRLAREPPPRLCARWTSGRSTFPRTRWPRSKRLQ